MANIGFTTGSLYKSDIPLDERIRLYHSLGASAIELSFLTPSQLSAFQLSGQIEKYIHKFSSVSIHAPCKDIRYDGNKETQEVIEKLRALCHRLPITGLVLHPDTIDDFEVLETSGLPFLLENMDRRKASGTHPIQFREFKRKYGFGFVLDVQHAYEHDSTMQLARELIDVMGDRLKHMHVSGYNDLEIHVPVYCAINKAAITAILRISPNVPKILEGILTENIQDSIVKELNYVQNFERDW